jgi:hypothetical protein
MVLETVNGRCEPCRTRLDGEPLDALQIVCRDRDEWKARAEKAEAELKHLAICLSEDRLKRIVCTVESEIIARVVAWLRANDNVGGEWSSVAGMIEAGEWRKEKRG